MWTWLSQVWPLPDTIPKQPQLSDAIYFSQYLQRNEYQPRGKYNKRKLAILTAKEAEFRARQCEKKYEEFKEQMGEYRRAMAEQLERMDTRWLDSSLKDFPSQPELRGAFLLGYHTRHCDTQEERSHELYKEVLDFYETKAKKTRVVEKSLEASKKAAQETMEQHWDIITNSQWSYLNIPDILQNVLSFFSMKELDKVMRTCSQMLHFVHSHVPVTITARDMGNKSFNKWLSSFHHFHSLDCISTKNLRKGTMYWKLSEIAKNKYIDALGVGQPASFKPKYFEMFQQTIQQHQTLVELSVEASMVPCFLTHEQLGRLQKLTLLNLNKNNTNATKWVEKLPSMEAVKVLKISSFDFPLRNITLPENVRKLIVEESDQCITDEPDGMRKKKQIRTRSLALPNIQNCKNLKELWINGVQDLTSLSQLKHTLKVLKLCALRSKKMIWPVFVHVEKLDVRNRLPPPGTISTQQLTLAGEIDTGEISRFLDMNDNLTALSISSCPSFGDYPVTAIWKWEKSMKEGAVKFCDGYATLHKCLLNMGKRKRKRSENGSSEKESRPLKKQRTDS